MLVSALILAGTFIAIFTEGVHFFHRTKCALVGAASMTLAGQYFGFYGPESALHAIDWNVVFLLGAMMTVIAIMIPTGGFQVMAFGIARFARGRQFLLLCLLGTAVTALSLLLDNVTTVVIFGPLIILICQAMKVSPIPYLLAAALLTDTGGVATLVGDPPNLMIGSAANIDFNSFFLHMGAMVFIAWAGTLVGLRFLFARELAIKPDMSDQPTAEIKDRRNWYSALVALGFMVVGFILHKQLGWEAWVVAVVGMTLLILFARDLHLDSLFAEVEMSLLLFFMSLFVIVGGVEHSHFLQYIGQFIVPFVKEDLLLASVLLLWVSAILSAAIDNIPFTAAMIPIILGIEAQGVNVTPLWWALSAGVGMGGNGTHIGSTANVYIVTISERLAQETGNRAFAITPGVWFRRCTPVMLLTVTICMVIMVLFFDFFAKPLA
ncbi:MAG: arsenic transporter [Pseudomonadales bacterium]|nr:arsenic transporter [Pseudomonadales bacterium]